MVKICINCNAENLEEALFCKKCGTKLPTLKEIENARREEQEEADRKWREEIRKTKEKNEALNETRRNEGSISVYGSTNSNNTDRNLSIHSSELSSSSSSHKKDYTPPKRQYSDKQKRSQLNISLIMINLSMVVLFSIMIALGYLYMTKEGMTINTILDKITNNRSTANLKNSPEVNVEEIYGVYIDKRRELMWQDTIDNKKMILSWKDAKSYCDNLFLGNYIDWRIPIKPELESIIDINNNPAIKKEFIYVSKTFYWSTPIKLDSSFAWHVFFGKDGGADYEDMKNLNSIRCVRNY